MIEQFKRHVAQLWPNIANSKSLLALSGGLDSVVLAHLWQSCQWPFEVAHCNFKLRGEESDADAVFVQSLCDLWGVCCHSTAFDTKAYAQQHKLSVQEAARHLRYDYFYGLSEARGLAFILTAHHSNDQFETFLINTLRGTGLKGLTGIPTQNGKIIRPLLPFSKEALTTYAKKHHLEWREDSSNQSSDYLRNALRLKVIPELVHLRPQLLEEFGTTINHLQDAQIMIEAYLKDIQPQLLVKTPTGFKLPLEAWQQVDNPKTYLFYLLSPFGFHQWEDILHLMTAQSGKMVRSDTYQLLKDRACLLLEPKHDNSVSNILIYNQLKPIEFANKLLTIEGVETQELGSAACIYVDADLLNFPLTLRLWQAGDRFQPVGMTGTKKVSKYLKDETVSLFDKSRQYVLCSDEQIVWVVGRRADERFVVNAETKHILKLTLS